MDKNRKENLRDADVDCQVEFLGDTGTWGTYYHMQPHLLAS